MTKYETFFVESECVLAMSSDDDAYARERLSELSLAELDRFNHQLFELQDLISDRRVELVLEQALPSVGNEYAIDGLRQIIAELA